MADKKHFARGAAGTIGMLALELGAAKMTDDYGWPFVGFVALCGLIPLGWGWWPEIKSVRHIRLVLAAVIALSAIAVIGWNHWPFAPSMSQSNSTRVAGVRSKNKPWKSTLEDLYVNASPNLMHGEQEISFTAINKTNGLNAVVRMRFRLYQDFEAHSDFVSIYVPLFRDARLIDMAPDILSSLRDQIKPTRDAMRLSVGVGMGSPGAGVVWGKDLTFSGRVFIYTENPLTTMQIGDLVRSYEQQGMFLEIRGNDFWMFHKND